jgi:hypothetical protein
MSMNTVDNHRVRRRSMATSMTAEPSSHDVEQPFYNLTAELYNEPQVYDAVVIPDNQNNDDVDPKTILHLRLVKLAIVLFSVAGIALVIFSLAIDFGNVAVKQEMIPAVQGWSLVGGAPVFAPLQEAQYLFGSAVAMSGNGTILAVAAPGTDQDEENLLVGEVHIFKEIQGANGTEWDLVQSLPGPGPNLYPSSSLAMDRNGDRVAVGYPRFQRGQVQLFEQYIGGSDSLLGGEEQAVGGSDAAPQDVLTQDTAQWKSAGTITLVPKEKDIDASADPWFGFAVDLTSNGQYLAVGSPLTEPVVGGSQHGAVYFYQHNNNSSSNKNNNNETWTRLGARIVGGPQEQHLGWSLSLCTPLPTLEQESNNNNNNTHHVVLRVAIGAPASFESSGGAVRVHDLTININNNASSSSSSSWRQIGQTISGSHAGVRFGESVSMSDDGTVLAVGARGNALFDAGQVQVFRLVKHHKNNNENNNNTEDDDDDDEYEWVSDDQIFHGDEVGEGFGAAVSLPADGNTLAIGGPVSNEFGCKTLCEDASGRIQVYQYQSETREWIQQGSSLGGSDAASFGSALAISANGQRVAGGAPQSDFDGMNAGTGSVLVLNVLNNADAHA